MRIVAGRFRSRRLRTVPGRAVRPTPDRLRESLFSILAPRIEGSLVVDAYAGSGAVGLEALSRGARAVILIERSRAAISAIRQNIADLQVEREVTVVQASASVALSTHPADFVFVDPPYDLIREYDVAFACASLRPGGLLIAQHASRFTLPDTTANLRRTRLLQQGDNALSFYETIPNTYEIS